MGDQEGIALEATGVRKTYAKDGRSIAVLDVERFAVREGEFVTVIGPSGCGKCTSWAASFPPTRARSACSAAR